MTTGEKLVQLSTIGTGTALEHLLHISQTIAATPTINALDITSTTGIGISDGEITVFAGGGAPPYEYSVGSSYQSANTFTDLAANTYTISVRDTSGYTDTISGIKLSAPSSTPVISEIITIDASTVTSTDGSIKIIANGGTTPYRYSLNDGTYQSLNMFDNLRADVYSVSVKDNNDIVTKLSGIKISGTKIGVASSGGGFGIGGGVNRYRPSVRIKNVKSKDVEPNTPIKVKVTL